MLQRVLWEDHPHIRKLSLSTTLAQVAEKVEQKLPVMVEGAPTSFSPFSLVNCMLLSHFSFKDFIMVAFPDLAGDLDVQI